MGPHYHLLVYLSLSITVLSHTRMRFAPCTGRQSRIVLSPLPRLFLIRIHRGARGRRFPVGEFLNTENGLLGVVRTTSRVLVLGLSLVLRAVVDRRVRSDP